MDTACVTSNIMAPTQLSKCNTPPKLTTTTTSHAWTNWRMDTACVTSNIMEKRLKSTRVIAPDMCANATNTSSTHSSNITNDASMGKASSVSTTSIDTKTDGCQKTIVKISE